MMPNVVTVHPEASVEEAIRKVLGANVKRLPVTDAEGHVVGIVSRPDLLRPYLREDEEIRREVVEDLIGDTMG
jgi:CBS-domain-containing membrane protein